MHVFYLPTKTQYTRHVFEYKDVLNKHVTKN